MVSSGPFSSNHEQNQSVYLSEVHIGIMGAISNLNNFGYEMIRMDQDLLHNYGGQFCTHLTDIIYYSKYL